MGLFGSLVGWDQQKDAHNAALASLLLQGASNTTKQHIALTLVEMQREFGGRRLQSDEQILGDLSKLSRMQQMNFVAVACQHGGVPSPIAGVEFAAVRNPYRSDNDSSRARLDVAIKDISRRAGTGVSWAGHEAKENFAEWLSNDASTPASRRLKPEDQELADRALDLAAGSLLGGLKERSNVRSVVEELIGGHTAVRSPHDLALVTSLVFFLDPNHNCDLRPAQLMARMTALDWFQEGKVSRSVAEMFEERLYEVFK